MLFMIRWLIILASTGENYRISYLKDKSSVEEVEIHLMELNSGYFIKDLSNKWTMLCNVLEKLNQPLETHSEVLPTTSKDLENEFEKLQTTNLAFKRLLAL